MPTLITTPGAADANSYASLEEADAYHAGRTFAGAWFDAGSGERIVALIMTGRLIDAMPGAWTGVASSETQAMGWPRTGMLSRNGFAIGSGVIPNALKDAQAEYARQVIGEDLTETNAIMAQGISSVKAGPVAVTFGDQMSQRDAAVPANRAYAAMVPDAVKVLLVPSWLKDPRDEDTLYVGLVVENL